MHKSLQDEPPIPAEGFAAVKEIDVTSPQFFPLIPFHINGDTYKYCRDAQFAAARTTTPFPDAARTWKQA